MTMMNYVHSIAQQSSPEADNNHAIRSASLAADDCDDDDDLEHESPLHAQQPTSSALFGMKGTKVARGPSSSKPGYKRASRKNAPKRFKCEHDGCFNVYTRA